MDICASVRSAEMDDERLQRSAGELRRLINEGGEATATLPEGPTSTGSKGDPVTLGTIALTFLTSGAAVAVFKVLETFVGRKRAIEVELSRPDGHKLILRAQDMQADQIAATQRLFQKLVSK
jgi:hypothetical protein